MFKNLAIVSIGILLFSCSTETEHKQETIVKDTIVRNEQSKIDSTNVLEQTQRCANDSLNSMADIISGISDSSDILKFVKITPAFRSFSKSFDKRWMAYDSSRLSRLKKIRKKEISKFFKKQKHHF